MTRQYCCDGWGYVWEGASIGVEGGAVLVFIPPPSLPPSLAGWLWLQYPSSLCNVVYVRVIYEAF